MVDRSLRGRPNPFNPGTAFEFELAQESRIVLAVYDLRGRRVRTLFDGRLGSGPQRVLWDGRDSSGALLASGTYLACLERGDGSVSVTKVALLK